MEKPHRDIIRQPWLAYGLVVGLSPTPLSQASQQSGLSGQYDSFIVSVPTTAARVILMGDSSVAVAAANGLEIKPGVPVQLSIRNERQLYEVQAPIVDAECTQAEGIPIVVWDVSNIYFVTLVAPVTVGILLFKVPFS